MTKATYLSKDKTTSNKIRASVHFLLLPLLLLSSLLISSIHAQTVITTTKQNKTIKIGINESDAPFVFVLPNGRATGLFVEIWQEWADINDHVVVFVPMDFYQTISQLKSGEIDMQAGLFINDERTKWADFSVAIAQVHTKLFYHDKTKNKLTLSELSDVKVGVAQGTFQDTYLMNNYPEIIRVDLPTKEEFVTNILNGNVHAGFTEEPTFNSWLEREGLKGTIVPSQNAIVTNTAHGMFRKDNTYLKSIVNTGFKNIPVATLRRIEQKWLSSDSALFKDYEIKLDNLTFSEQEWLATNLNFSLGVSPSLMPLEWIDEHNLHQGVSADYVNIVKDLLSINMKPKLNLSWSEVIEDIKNKKIDVIPAIVKTESRESFINFTKPYISLPVVITSSRDREQIQNLSDLQGKIVAVEKSSFVEELLRRNHPNLTLFAVDNALEGMDLLENNKVDSYVTGLAVAVYHINSGNFKNIKIAAYTDYKVDIAMGVRKGLEPLQKILDKALDSLTAKEKAQIYNSWFTVRIDTGASVITFVLWSVPILSLLMIIIFWVIRGNRILSTEINRRYEVELKLINEKANTEKANLAAMSEQNRHNITLTKTNNQLIESSLKNQFLARKVVNIQEEERKAISMTLHDELGQNIYALKLNLMVVSNRIGESKLIPILNDMESIINIIYESTNTLMHWLRPIVLDELGLKAALYEDAFIKLLKNADIHYSTNIIGNLTLLNDELAIAIYRITQESITNAAKYSKAKHCELSLTMDNSIVELEIKDDGEGFDLKNRDKKASSFGIQGIEDRVLALGGNYTLTSNSTGTCHKAKFNI